MNALPPGSGLNTWIRRLCISSFLYFICLPLSFGAPPTTHAQFTRYLAQHGLSVGNVSAIHQDSDGFMWFGGFDGLARFDGYQFEKFSSTATKHVLADNGVTDIVSDGTDLWIATRGGLTRFNRVTQSTEHFKSGVVTQESIRKMLLIDRDLYLATYGGLIKFNIDSHEFLHISSIPYAVLGIAQGQNADLWLGTNGFGLIRVDTKSTAITQFGHDPARSSLVNNQVWDVFVDKNGNVWAGTDDGLSMLDVRSRKFITYQQKNGLLGKTVSDITEDSDGLIWVATNNGLTILNPTTSSITHLTHNPHDDRSLSSENVRTIFFDNNSDVWISTFPSGVNFLNRSDLAFSTTRFNPDRPGAGGLMHRSVLTFLDDSQGALWIGTDGGGINRVATDNTIYHYAKNPDVPLHPEYISANAVLDAIEDVDGTFWFGTWGGGLNHFDPKTKRFSHHLANTERAGALQINNIWILHRDHENTLWIGTTGGGLYRYERDKNTFFHYNERHGFDTPVVWDIHTSRDGQLWIGSDKGLKKYNPSLNAFSSYYHDANDPHSIGNKAVLTIHDDAETGNLWLGTRGGGLNRFDTKTGRVIRYTDGLPSLIVTSIEDDDAGNLWLGTHAGLSRFTPATGAIKNYTERNGLQGNHFNINASIKLKTGELIFGGTNGYTRFLPSLLAADVEKSTVKLRDLRILNKRVEIGEGVLKHALSYTTDITLSHKQSMLAIDYASLNYRAAGTMHYAYKLDGFDQEWNEVGNVRTATYTNLDAGTYVFKVKASPAGTWSDDDAFTSMTIHVLPPWYLTWWSIAVYILIAASAIYYGIDNQRRKKNFFKEQARLLEQRVTERTTELVQREKLAALGSLVAGVSHELNTPIGNGLTVASAIAESSVEFEKIVASGLTKSQLDTFVAETREGSQLIVSALRRAADLVSSFKQVAVDRTSEQRREFTLASVLYEIKMLMRNTLKSSPITLEIYHGIDVRLESYPGPLEQVLSNLINNALVHAFEGRDAGRIVIRTADIDEGRGVRIEVEDNGIGIDRANLKRIFDPFFTTKLGAGGSGLGLHIVHNLLICHLGGTIDVDSDLGRGTRFILRIPLIAPLPTTTQTTTVNNEHR